MVHKEDVMTTIGVLKERKIGERRVAMTPIATEAIVAAGHSVVIETGAGLGSGFSDAMYAAAGAAILLYPEAVASACDILVKVKEPQPEEYELLMLLSGKVLFTYLHLAGVDKSLTEQLCLCNVTAIPYEAVWEEVGGRRHYPLLEPMSSIAGREAVKTWRAKMGKKFPKRGYWLATVIGAGTVGMAAVEEILQADHAKVAILEQNTARRRELERKFDRDERVSVHSASPANVTVFAGTSDLIVSAVMVPGSAKAPTVITHDQIMMMQGEVYIADVAIDQGGSTAVSKPTKPGQVRTMKTKSGGTVSLSCVQNIPGTTVPEEATRLLVAQTIKYILELAERSPYSCSGLDERLTRAIATMYGRIMHPAVAEAHGLEYLLAKLPSGDAS